MKNQTKILAPLVTLLLALGPLAACAPTHFEDQPGEIKPAEATRPPDLAAGPATGITIANPVNTGYGEAVDLSGDTLVIGASDWNGFPGGSQYGSVYVYQRIGKEWGQQIRLMSSDGHDGFQYDQHFGRSVAIEGDTIVVGAPDADHPTAGDNTGAVYVYRRAGDAWEEFAKLEAADPQPHERFGNRVKMDGDRLAIAADQNGALYVFGWDGSAWIQQARLSFPFPPESESRQVSLALHADTLAVGVGSFPFDQDENSTVFVFQRKGDNWTESARLEGKRDFGVSLALGASPAAPPGQADTLAIGADVDSSAGLYAGAVYVYSRQGDGWKEQVRLTAADSMIDLPFPSNNTFFGCSLALQGDLLLVLSRFSSTVYIYQGGGDRWTDQLEVNVDTGLGEPEAWPIAMDGSTVIEGTPGEFGNSAHVFEIFTR
jgi:hypothetical protein